MLSDPGHTEGVRNRLGVILVVVCAALLFAAPALAGMSLYRTDAQAQRYLEHGLHRWAGINLRTASFKSAFCINGYYSKHESRTGHHYPQGKTNRYGEDLFRSFTCTLAVNSRSFHLYVLTTRLGWRVSADR